MNRTITVFFLLFMLLITGAFASMAQNNYGFIILGWVALGFTLMFGYQLLKKIQSGKSVQKWKIAELTGLMILSLMFCLSNFHFRVPYADMISSAAALLLAVVYVTRLKSFLQREQEGGLGKLPAIAYYGGVILFLLVFALSPFLPAWVLPMNSIAFVLLLIFLAVSFVLPGIRKGWGEVQVLKVVNGFRDRSFIIASFCFLIAMYAMSVRQGWLPPLYSDDYPKVFFDLNERQARDKAKLAGPETTQAVFKEKYERFVQVNLEQKP